MLFNDGKLGIYIFHLTSFCFLLITHQHAMHVECDIVLPIFFPSVCPMPVLCLNEWIYYYTFLTAWYGHHSSFLLQNFKGNPQRGH